MKKIETSLPGVWLLEPEVVVDQRGFFFESYNERKWHELGILDRFVQDNHSRSGQGTLRGLHYQIEHQQAKVCRVSHGEVLDVAVDIRVGSPTFGRHVQALLSGENKRQIYIPPGFAHGFLVLSASADFMYKCSDFYHREFDRGIAWDDPVLGIDWGVEQPILSARDREHPRLSEVPEEDLPRYPDHS